MNEPTKNLTNKRTKGKETNGQKNDEQTDKTNERMKEERGTNEEENAPNIYVLQKLNNLWNIILEENFVVYL